MYHRWVRRLQVYSLKKLALLISVVVIGTITIGLIALEAHHHLKYGHFFPLGLHADVTDFQSDIASGPATFFDGHLTNFGLYPQEIERCEFVSDAETHEASVAYRVEQFDYSAHRWKTVFDNKQNFCRPHPLAIIQAKLVTKTLWTGQTLAAATAYRAIPNGDTMRFVIEANGREFPTGRFSVIEVYGH